MHYCLIGLVKKCNRTKLSMSVRPWKVKTILLMADAGHCKAVKDDEDDVTFGLSLDPVAANSR